MRLALVGESGSTHFDSERGAFFPQINSLAKKRMTSLNGLHILCYHSMILGIDNVGAMQAEKLLIGIAMHVACSRIGLDDETIPIPDDQSITGGLKDAAVLLFSLAQLFFGLSLALPHACEHVAETCQQTPLPRIFRPGVDWHSRDAIWVCDDLLEQIQERLLNGRAHILPSFLALEQVLIPLSLLNRARPGRCGWRRAWPACGSARPVSRGFCSRAT